MMKICEEKKKKKKKNGGKGVIGNTPRLESRFFELKNSGKAGGCKCKR